MSNSCHLQADILADTPEAHTLAMNYVAWPHPHCRESLALCPQRLAVAAAEDSRGCAKARGSTVVPASAQGLGCLQSAGKWGWGRSWWPPHPKDRPVTGTRPVLAASHARLLTGDTDPGSCIRCSACPGGPHLSSWRFSLCFHSLSSLSLPWPPSLCTEITMLFDHELPD